MATMTPDHAVAGPPGTVTEFVVEQLRDRIVLGTLQPGSKVSIYALADEFGVSRVPLREAVRQLEAESLVENLPRRGTIVRPLRAEDIIDTYEMLDKIEVIAAQRAAASEGNEIADEMQYWLDEMKRLTRDDVPSVSADMLHAHRAFHFALFKGAGEGVLQQHLSMLWNTAERYVINARTPERQRAANREHAELVKKIAAKDVDGVTEALHAHLHASRTATMQRLEESGVTPAGVK